MQVTVGDLLAGETQRVPAIFFGLKEYGNLIGVVGVDNGIVLASLREIDLGVLGTQLELAEGRPVVETQDGIVQYGTLVVAYHNVGERDGLLLGSAYLSREGGGLVSR